MTSQERMAQLTRAIGHLSEAMNVMIDQQAQRDLLDLQHEERIRASEERIRASEEQLRAIHADLAEKTVRIRELIGVANQIQAEIARLDSAS